MSVKDEQRWWRKFLTSSSSQCRRWWCWSRARWLSTALSPSTPCPRRRLASGRLGNDLFVLILPENLWYSDAISTLCQAVDNLASLCLSANAPPKKKTKKEEQSEVCEVSGNSWKKRGGKESVQAGIRIHITYFSGSLLGAHGCCSDAVSTLFHNLMQKQETEQTSWSRTRKTRKK